MRREARRRDASYMIDWVEGKSTCAFTPSYKVASRCQQMDPGDIWLCDLARSGTNRKGKHAFWQLTNGSSRAYGICHQSYQWFSMLNVSDDAWDRLWSYKPRRHRASKYLIASRMAQAKRTFNVISPSWHDQMGRCRSNFSRCIIMMPCDIVPYHA